jgi:hypothetical protein
MPWLGLRLLALDLSEIRTRCRNLPQGWSGCQRSGITPVSGGLPGLGCRQAARRGNARVAGMPLQLPAVAGGEILTVAVTAGLDGELNTDRADPGTGDALTERQGEDRDDPTIHGWTSHRRRFAQTAGGNGRISRRCSGYEVPTQGITEPARVRWVLDSAAGQAVVQSPEAASFLQVARERGRPQRRRKWIH